MATYSKTSPYFTTDIINGYLDVITARDFPKQADDILWEVTQNYQYRPDLLAWDLYDDQTLWWVFAVRNPVTLKDPVFDLVAGRKIYLPKITTLKESLGI